MATAKVDQQAIDTELQRISALMTEIARQMNPQTWQGGAAGNFTIDLKGHIGSLGQMMSRVLEAVARINELPMVLERPAMPQVTPASGERGVASVSTSRLERLEVALRRAGQALPGHGRRIAQLLSEADPSSVSTAQSGRTAAWCDQEAGRTRTRIRYAMASDQINPAWLLNRGMTQIPDAGRFGRAEMARLGELQAKAYSHHLKNPNEHSQQVLAEIGRSVREHATDKTYLNTFFSNVPPGSVGKLAHFMHRRADGTAGLDNPGRRIIGDFGTALASLSRDKNGQAAVRRALGRVGSDMPGQALLVKLSAPEVRWSSAVLAELGKGSLRWRQTHPSYEITESSGAMAGEQHTSVVNQPHRRWWEDWRINGGSGVGDADLKKLRDYDPALNILNRIAQQKDTTAARELAATKLDKAFTIKDAEKANAITWLSRGNGETYAALLVAPDWMDSGAAAGKVIRLATTPEKGNEEQAAENAAEIMKSVAWWNEKGRANVHKFLNESQFPKRMPWAKDRAPGWFADSKQYSAEYGGGLRDGLLQMTRTYIPALGDANRTSAGTQLPNVDPATGRTYVDIAGVDIQQFLRTFAADDKQWAQLALDTHQYRQLLNTWAFRNNSLPIAVTRGGYLEGNLIAAYLKERVEREKLTKEQYEQIKADLTAFRDAGAMVLDQTPVGQSPLVGYGYEQGTTLLLDKIKYSDFDKKVEAIKAKGANYSDQLFVDLARGYRSSLGHAISDSTVESLLQKPALTSDEKTVVARWAKQHIFRSGNDRLEIDKQRGEDIIRQIQTGVDHNAPPPMD